MITKPDIRARVRAALVGLSALERAEKARLICAHIVEHQAWKTARCVALYAAVPGEVDLRPLWAARDDRQFLLPRVVERALEFCAVESPQDLRPGRFGIMEPRAGAAVIAAAEIHLMLVPGLAFGLDGARIGRGGGFYDRALADESLRARKIAVGFAVQLFDRLPTEPHDQPMDGVITELGVA